MPEAPADRAGNHLNAFAPHAPLATANNGRKGPLAGRTLAVKDIHDVQAIRSGWGLPDRLAETAPAKRTASAVQALVEAGAEIVGKTQCDELCFSLMGNNAFYPRVVNPRAPERFTGGSSAGSAAAVAGGLVDIATASDTGGSVRAPASFCGLVGLRTTQGLIATDHTMPLAPSLDTFGWFAADVDLYAQVGAVLLPESTHSFGRLVRIPELDALTADDAAGEAYAAMCAAVERRFGAARQASLSTLDVDDRYRCFRDIQAHEAWAAQGEWVAAPNRDISPAIRERFLYGRTITAEKYAGHMRNRRRFTAELEALIGDDSLLVLPTVPGAAPRADSDDETEHAYRAAALRLLCLSGLSGLPQITLPLGGHEGAPFGVSLIGPRRSDRALIEAARQLLTDEGRA